MTLKALSFLLLNELSGLILPHPAYDAELTTKNELRLIRKLLE